MFKVQHFWFLAIACLLLGCTQNDPIAVKINGVRLRKSEFNHKLQLIDPHYRNYANSSMGKKQFLEILIKEKLLLAEAKRLALANTQENRERLVRFRAEQKRQRQEFLQELLIGSLMEQIRSKELTVASHEIQEYYKKYPVEFIADHILLPSESETQKIWRRLKEGGNFSAIAKAVSMDPETAAEGGSMKPFVYGEILPELNGTFSKLHNWEISPIVKSRFGYHILRKRKEKPIVFEEAEPRIRKILERQKLERYLESLRAKYKVEIHEHEIQ